MIQAPKSRFGFSGLSLIALCFALAALLRAGDMAVTLSTAQAASHAGQKPAEPARPEATALAPPTPLLPPPLSADFSPDGRGTPSLAAAPAVTGESTPEALLAAIRARTATLDERERKIAEKERALEVAAERVAAELRKLEQERKAFESAIAEARQINVDGTEHLVKIYQSMKPKPAAAIFNEMDPRVAAVFLREMRGEAASLIIANMDTKKAYAITLLMAGRRFKGN